MPETTPKFPRVHVQLVGQDGNALAIIGRCKSALQRGGATPTEVSEFVSEVMSGDYDNVLATVMRWVKVH